MVTLLSAVKRQATSSFVMSCLLSMQPTCKEKWKTPSEKVLFLNLIIKLDINELTIQYASSANAVLLSKVYWQVVVGSIQSWLRHFFWLQTWRECFYYLVGFDEIATTLPFRYKFCFEFKVNKRPEMRENISTPLFILLIN